MIQLLELLISSCSGEAKECILKCIMCEFSDMGYREARRILENNFGKMSGIVSENVKRLIESLP